MADAPHLHLTAKPPRVSVRSAASDRYDFSDPHIALVDISCANDRIDLGLGNISQQMLEFAFVDGMPSQASTKLEHFSMLIDLCRDALKANDFHLGLVERALVEAVDAEQVPA